jgi:hypothetical protein
MRKPLNFKQLVDIYEATAPVKSTPPPVGGTIKAAIKSAAGGLKDIAKQAIFDPHGLASKIEAANKAGVPGLAKGIYNIPGNIRAQKESDLKNYYLKLSMPNGWPKKGSIFSIVSMYNGEYTGTVTNIQKISEEENVLTIVAQPADPKYPRLAMVVTIDETQLPFYAVKKYIVSNITSNNKYIKNEKESGHLPRLEFNAEIGKFELNSKERPDTIVIIPKTGDTKTYKQGDTLTGIDFESGEEITGTVAKVFKEDRTKGLPIRYSVKYLPPTT